ncbi:MAG: hypothetical protein HY914_17080 [Desulfomonile tiedjei]|nr:hypothetical protein [Desulfomonile tiedjei]
MGRSRFLCLWLSAALAATLLVSNALAWEFRMEGTFNYVYEFYGQQGAKGFFGVFDVDRSVGVGGVGPLAGDYAALNLWAGRQVGRSANDFAAGADGVKHYQNLELWPDFQLNRAVRFRAKYRLGQYGDPINSDYLTNTRPGVNVATSDGQWTMWWVTAHTPVGIIVVGKRPEAFGTGLQFNGESNNTTEGVALVAPYGPLRISLAFRPQWFLQPDFEINTRNAFYNILDKNNVRQLSVRFFTTYQSGPIDAGIFWAGMRWHAGKETQSPTATVPPGTRTVFHPYDVVLNLGTFYVKFNNGWAFFNTELAYYNECTTTLDAAVPGPRYKESWRYMAETGLFAGPAKISFLYAFMPGADRRGGALINKQPFTQGAGQGAYDVFRPYSYLIGYAYGSGVNAFNINGDGYINAASVLATRIDYALAANLNLFGTFLWAERSSHGYPWGHLRPNQAATVTRGVNAAGALVDNVTWTPSLTYRQYAGAPNIPDTALGWEVTAGLDWKLLEKYTLEGLFAYWQPGRWFNHACIDRAMAAWDTQTDATPFYPFGANPDRRIDPMMGASISLTVDF